MTIHLADRKTSSRKPLSLLKLLTVSFLVVLSACGSKPQLPAAQLYPSQTNDVNDYTYLIGPRDNITVFVWGNPEISGGFIVRPDGMITTSLVEDIPVSGKTPTQVAREIEKILATYIRDPIVTVSVTRFNGPFSEQVRIIGEADEPQAIPYVEQMTLLDVMIEVDGLTEFADGDRAVLARIEDGAYKEYELGIESLINDGDISANIDILPGDIIFIPEAWF